MACVSRCGHWIKALCTAACTSLRYAACSPSWTSNCVFTALRAITSLDMESFKSSICDSILRRSTASLIRASVADALEESSSILKLQVGGSTATSLPDNLPTTLSAAPRIAAVNRVAAAATTASAAAVAIAATDVSVGFSFNDPLSPSSPIGEGRSKNSSGVDIALTKLDEGVPGFRIWNLPALAASGCSALAAWLDAVASTASADCVAVLLSAEVASDVFGQQFLAQFCLSS
eukprot:CAMPEP_0172883604 /NCGR_PEP_ID=MMETSP1075-20121228/123012_1 /TAXON_ID=2916 /ORGANISM="Ceratium fusus, Strain PA161109" /LENGTH=232 /DNA_ID=CAMNT_0013736527 /DNA_START=569 /DNA_END=1263 /DNA_ORIENTATION=+